MLVGPIPSSFIQERTSLSLAELRWAFDNGVIGAQIVVDVAKSKAAREEDDSIVVRQLAAVAHPDLPQVREILLEVPLDNEEVNAIRRKWVWLVLSWLYENQRDDADVFDKVDGLYADFGYPEEMAAFGPYAPAYQVKGDSAQVREQVVGEWRQYLTRAGEEFGRGRTS
jgi:hypothetical protein